MNANNSDTITQRAVAALNKYGRVWQEPKSGNNFITISIDTSEYERHAISLSKSEPVILVIEDDLTLFSIRIGDPAVDEKVLGYLSNLLDAFDKLSEADKLVDQ